MPGYISEGIRYYRVANNHRTLVECDSQNAFVCILFSAMYIESIVNELIFQEQLFARLHEEHFGEEPPNIEIDIYNEMKSFIDKVHIIFNHYNVNDYRQDAEFIELSHLMTMRGFLAHLKPVEQIQGGAPERRICRAALNYLHQARIIEDPFAQGVFWTDVLMNKEVADWAVSTVVSAIRWMFEKTHDGRLGNHTLSWHCQLTRDHA